jgi:hypothetical protein
MRRRRKRKVGKKKGKMTGFEMKKGCSVMTKEGLPVEKSGSARPGSNLVVAAVDYLLLKNLFDYFDYWQSEKKK